MRHCKLTSWHCKLTSWHCKFTLWLCKFTLRLCKFTLRLCKLTLWLRKLTLRLCRLTSWLCKRDLWQSNKWSDALIRQGNLGVAVEWLPQIENGPSGALVGDLLRSIEKDFFDRITGISSWIVRRGSCVVKATNFATEENENYEKSKKGLATDFTGFAD